MIILVVTQQCGWIYKGLKLEVDVVAMRHRAFAKAHQSAQAAHVAGEMDALGVAAVKSIAIEGGGDVFHVCNKQRVREDVGTQYDFVVRLCNGHTTSLIGVATCINCDDFSKGRSEEHTSEPQSHSEISYAVCCLKKKNNNHVAF